VAQAPPHPSFPRRESRYGELCRWAKSDAASEASQKAKRLRGYCIGRAAINSDEAFALQVQNDLLRGLLWRQLSCVDCHFSISRFLVGIRNSGKFLQDARTRFRIESFSVALFTDVQ